MEDYMKEYEEFKSLPQVWGWVVLIVVSAALLGFGMFSHMIIQDDENRTWDFGAKPLAPGESRYNTRNPGAGNGPDLQMLPLPEARPLERLSPDTGKPYSRECP